MLPRDLKSASFAAYPPEAQALAVAHLRVLQRMPLAFIPSLLRRLIDYDFSFPAERSATDSELARLSSLSEEQISEFFQGFTTISLSSALEKFDWVNNPAQFVEQQSAYLWSTHQLDRFRNAATEYGDRLAQATPIQPLPMQRLGIAIIGQGVSAHDEPLFGNLRKHGTYFTQVSPDSALETLLFHVEERARSQAIPYAHWYVDGGAPLAHTSAITCISYENLAPLRMSLLKRMQAEIARPGMGPEELRTDLARMTPADFGADEKIDPVLSRFHLKLFTEGSGTQIYSTTFAQWTAREILRRAQALTLLVRFSPRQRQRSMNELLSGTHPGNEMDPQGSLVDADMGAYYHWIDQQRLPGADRSAFVAWFEAHGEAVAIGPAVPHGAESRSPVEMQKILSMISA